ncbi:MAG: rhomboid family intramembrane serine protease, partial [Candidatus Acidiferrales bacterium]
MIPLKNLRPRTHFPALTLTLIIINFIVFFYQLTLDPRALQSFIITYSMIPARTQLALAHSQYTLAQG